MVNSRLIICWLPVGRDWVVRSWPVHHWGRMIGLCSSLHYLGRVVDWSWLVSWNMGWCMDSSAVFFTSIGVMDILWGSMGLAGDNSSIRSMGFVDGVTDCWGISMLNDLMVCLIS